MRIKQDNNKANQGEKWGGRAFPYWVHYLGKNRLLRLSVTIFLLGSTWLSSLFACPYSFRQAGFVELDQVLYSAYFVIEDTTPNSENLSRWIKASSIDVLKESNVETKFVNIDREPSHRAAMFCKSMEITSFPCVLVFAPEGKGMLLANAPQNGVSKIWIRSKLQKVISSPVREEINRHIISNWCVVLLVKGENTKKNQWARSEIESAVKQVTGLITETGQVVKEGPRLLTVSRDAADERVLLWSLGIKEEKNQPQAIVLYGRGRQLGPVFEGALITTSAFYNLFYLLGRRCVCTIDRRWLSGHSIPMKWPAWFHDEVMQKVGIDIFSPEVKLQIVPGMRWIAGDGVPMTLDNYSESVEGSRMIMGPMGYTEITLGSDSNEEGAASVVPEGMPRPRQPVKSAFSFSNRARRIVFYIVLGLSFVALVGSTAILKRRRA